MKFCLMSDTHRGFSPKQAVLLKEMLEQVAEEKPDIILHAGDVGSHKIHQRFDFWTSLRRTPGLESIPVVFVLGNHDYWDKGTRFAETFHKDLERFHVTGLQGTMYSIPETSISVFGFTGWYKHEKEFMNDKHNIPNYSYGIFRSRTDRYIQQTLGLIQKSRAKTKILLTHFDFIEDPNRDNDLQEQPGLLSVFSDVDYIVSGHSHRQVDGLVVREEPKRTTYFNPGGGYEDPKYLMVEIGD